MRVTQLLVISFFFHFNSEKIKTMLNKLNVKHNFDRYSVYDKDKE